MRKALESADGFVEMTVQRKEKNEVIRLSPEVTEDGPKLGVYLKQSITGVGTVTWYDPDTGRFAALGHGVNDQRGELLDMVSGKAYRATIVNVRKGSCGDPGQLMGALKDSEPVGNIYKNSVQGIFGMT